LNIRPSSPKILSAYMYVSGLFNIFILSALYDFNYRFGLARAINDWP